MRVLFTYKSTEAVKKEVAKGMKVERAIFDTIGKIGETVDLVVEKLFDTRDAVINAPLQLHVKFIKFRLGMTDKYLDAKAKGCQKLLRALALERKRIVQEQEEAITALKELRTTFTYPENPLVK